MNKKRLVWIAPALLGVLATLVVLFSIEQSRTFLIALLIRVFLFAKHHVVAILSAFFLVNGKFILSFFLKKVTILSATGLGKRYFIEKVLTHHIKIHFLDHIRDDLSRLADYIKKNFKKFPIVKQVLAIVTFLGSLGFVGKFMGWMIAIKVFLAKFWSFLLAIFLKTGTAVFYFFTDYLWGSWIAPLLEVFIFSWLLEWLERIPFLKKFFQMIYQFFSNTFAYIEAFMERIFHLPMRRFFGLLVQKIKRWIDTFMEVKPLSLYERLQERRAHKPNIHRRVQRRRQRESTEKTYRSAFERLRTRRMLRAQ
jgi:hypothetical protein